MVASGHRKTTALKLIVTYVAEIMKSTVKGYQEAHALTASEF